MKIDAAEFRRPQRCFADAESLDQWLESKILWSNHELMGPVGNDSGHIVRYDS